MLKNKFKHVRKYVVIKSKDICNSFIPLEFIISLYELLFLLDKMLHNGKQLTVVLESLGTL